MSRTGFRARVVEVFPMRLGREVLVDVTLEIATEGDFDPPRPDDVLVLPTEGDGSVELSIWAAPRISQPEGTRRVNVQIRREEITGLQPEDGMEVEVRPWGA